MKHTFFLLLVLTALASSQNRFSLTFPHERGGIRRQTPRASREAP